MKAAVTSINRLRSYKLRLDTEKFGEGASEQVMTRTSAALDRFDSSLDDDLNTAEALAAIFEYIRDTNSAMDSGEFKAANVASAQSLMARFDSIFDVLKPTATDTAISEEKIGALIAERQQARKQKDFKRSDDIRAELLEQGIILEDTKEGVRWKKK